MDNDSTTCSPDSSRISKKELNDVLDERGIALNTTGQKLLDFVAGGEMVCEGLHQCTRHAGWSAGVDVDIHILGKSLGEQGLVGLAADAEMTGEPNAAYIGNIGGDLKGVTKQGGLLILDADLSGDGTESLLEVFVH